MKGLMFVMVLLNSGLLKAQASLEVVARNCRNDNQEIILADFKIYRDDVFIEKVVPLWIEDASKAEELESFDYQ